MLVIRFADYNAMVRERLCVRVWGASIYRHGCARLDMHASIRSSFFHFLYDYLSVVLSIHVRIHSYY